jgi:hypothetical protein
MHKLICGAIVKTSNFTRTQTYDDPPPLKSIGWSKSICGSIDGFYWSSVGIWVDSQIELEVKLVDENK